MNILFILAALLILLALRVPVAFAILIPCVAYIVLSDSLTLGIALQRLTMTLNSFTLLAIPLFILVGFVANESGMASRLIDALLAVIGRLRGGLAYVNVASSLGFSTMSGSATSDTAAMGSIMVPSMRKHGYSTGFAAGLTGAASLVGPMMPPSVVAILYAVLSQSSVAGVFLAGVLPAFVIFFALSLYVFFRTFSKDPENYPRKPMRERLRMIAAAVPIMLTPVVILGGILGGVFTVTEAASVAAIYLIALGLGTRWMSIKQLARAAMSTSLVTARVMLIATAGGLLAYIMTREGAAQDAAQGIQALTENPVVFLLILNVALLLVGTFLEPASALLIVVPVVLPIALEYGIDPLHLGVIVILSLSIGLLTPPVGLVLFVLTEVGGVSMQQVIRGVLPPLGVLVTVLMLVTYVPGISLWLPNALGLG